MEADHYIKMKKNSIISPRQSLKPFQPRSLEESVFFNVAKHLSPPSPKESMKIHSKHGSYNPSPRGSIKPRLSLDRSYQEKLERIINGTEHEISPTPHMHTHTHTRRSKEHKPSFWGRQQQSRKNTYLSPDQNASPKDQQTKQNKQKSETQNPFNICISPRERELEADKELEKDRKSITSFESHNNNNNTKGGRRSTEKEHREVVKKDSNVESIIGSVKESISESKTSMDIGELLGRRRSTLRKGSVNRRASLRKASDREKKMTLSNKGSTSNIVNFWNQSKEDRPFLLPPTKLVEKAKDQNLIQKIDQLKSDDIEVLLELAGFIAFLEREA